MAPGFLFAGGRANRARCRQRAAIFDTLMLRFFRVRHHVLIALVFASSVAPLPAQAAPLDPLPASDGKWRHFRSPNFELYSRDGAQQSRELLHRLELLRAVFFDTFKLQERHRLDVTIFLFNRDHDFRTYLPASLGKSSTFEAYHAAYPDRAFIVLGPVDDRLAAQQTIFHEYIHAATGPSAFEMLNWVELSITAFGRSRRSTSDGMNACQTGAFSAAVAPPTAASANRSQ